MERHIVASLSWMLLAVLKYMGTKRQPDDTSGVHGKPYVLGIVERFGYLASQYRVHGALR